MQNKINPIIEASDNVIEKKHEEFVVVPIRDPESLQSQYATAHRSTGRELIAFVVIIVLVTIGFFAALKVL